MSEERTGIYGRRYLTKSIIIMCMKEVIRSRKSKKTKQSVVTYYFRLMQNKKTKHGQRSVLAMYIKK